MRRLSPAFWLVNAGLCLLGAFSAYGQNIERTQGAVQVFSREVAIRVFNKLADDKVKVGKKNVPIKYASLAKKIANTLENSPYNTDILAIINDSETQPVSFSGATGKLKELINIKLPEDSPDSVIRAVLENRLIEWRKKNIHDHLAYSPQNVPKEEIIAIVTEWLEYRPLHKALLQDSTNRNYNDADMADDESNQGDSTTPLNSLSFALLYFTIGALMAISVGFWFWYRPKQYLAEKWNKVSKLVRDNNFPLKPYHPDKGPLIVEQLTSLIETFHKKSIDSSMASQDINNQDHVTIRHLRELLGNGDLVDIVRSLKEVSSMANQDINNQDHITIRNLRDLLGDGDLIETVRSLKKEVQEIAVESSKEPNQGVQINKLSEIEGVPERAQHIFAYFSQPSPDGWFNDSQRSTKPTPDTCYRFTLLNSVANTATFRFEANPERLPRFLNLRSYFIDPACESQNNYQPSHSRVATINEGKVRLSNGQWYLEDKAQIRFE